MSERLFDENKFLSLLWKLQRAEADKKEILDAVDAEIRKAKLEAVREFAGNAIPRIVC